jgi:acyl-CoA synthetase (AMP-forming)/AMP-acid ligase II
MQSSIILSCESSYVLDQKPGCCALPVASRELRDLRIAPTTAGRPPLGTRIAILGQDGNPLPVGAVGRIFVGNDMLFDGYTNAASPAIEDQLMDTGDLGYLDASGRLSSPDATTR